MTLPTPDRTFPNTDTVGPPGPTGGDYADKVAAEGQALWDRVINVLGNIDGSANAITADCDPPLVASYQHGQQFWLVPTDNNTGPVTLNVDLRGAVDLVAHDGAPLVADDLVAGQGLPVVFDGDTGDMRLMLPTVRALEAIASQGGEQVMELIGDSGAIGTVSNVEFTFVPGRYSRIIMISTGMLYQSAPTAGATQHTLRHSGGAVLTLRGNTSATNGRHTHRSEFIISAIDASDRQIGWMDGVNPGGLDEVNDYASTATPPDRVRFAFANSGGSEAFNVHAGRVIAWGMRGAA